MLSENITLVTSLLNLSVVRKAAYQFNIYCKEFKVYIYRLIYMYVPREDVEWMNYER
jgi:hypothetical protein